VTDERLEIVIGNLLRVGVTLSAAVVAAGGFWYLAGSGRAAPDYGQFRPDVRGLGSLAVLPHAEGLILIGLLLLIATPVVRVVFALAGFTLERDRTYVIATLVVLAILLYSIATAWL
jgi:uncharacterized membrane protein